MKHLPSAMLRRLRRSPRGVLIARIVRGTLYVKLGLALVLGLVTGLLYLRLSSGPLSFEGLSERVAGAIASRIGPGWTVALTTSAIELEDGALALRTAGLDIRNPDGLSVVRSPHAIVSVDTLGLMTGSLQPRSIEFRDLQVRAALNRDGSLTFVAAEGSEPQAVTAPAAPPTGAPPAASAPAPGPDASAVSSALASLFDLVLEPRGVVGALDRARIGNARLTLVDSEGRDRASFEHVRAMFERNGSDGRRFELQVDGSDGGWRIEGDLRTGGSGAREGTIKATGIPVADILLLSGRSKFPATTDVKLAVEANAALSNGRLTRLDARLATSSGILQIDDKDMPPIDVESASAEAVWDEPRRTLGLDNVTFKSGRTDVRLRGEVAPTPESGWRLTASGRNAGIRGPQAEDPAFAIDNIEGALKTVEGGLELEKLALQGPTLNVALTGAFGTPSDPMALRVKGRATRTDVRTALRLWPNAVVPNLRNYLVENLRAGTVEAVDLAVAMSGRDLIDATGVGPIPDDAVKIEFAIKSGELRVTEGLPPLSGISATGAATGTTATVTVPTAQVQMPEGRTLSLSDGSFRLPKIWSREAQASVTFKLEGGADGLGALLQAPLLQGMASVDLDPAAIKGSTDLRVTLGLPLKDMPKIGNLPMAISGGIGGLTIDRAFGKERLENANLSVGYDRGNLGIRGEGKLWGVPASIDVRQQRNAPGEAVVSFTLDEAARARKGMSFGSQLAGPVPIRVALPLGKGAKPGAKIEADLTKAVVDNLVPGWVKPAGKPGKLSFLAATAAAPNGSSELREFTLDSGTAQMRGTLTLSAEGQLDRADLSSFKLSPGDDLKVLVERTGTIYHASIRGPVADARPFIRSLTAPTPSSQATSRESKESRDVDLDLAVNILTGFNDEALTGASIKAAVRNRDLRQLQLNGKFRSAPVSAQLARFDRGAPVLMLESEDAGATLRFVDIYRRMHGGALALQVTTGDGPQNGAVTVDSFTLRDEPALKRIASGQPQGATDDRAGNAQMPRFDVNDVQFTKLKAEFGRNKSRLEFRDAAIWGTQVGFKLSGWVDYGRDRADISGTFVPAYGLNNVFAQVPLFGPILGGGQNEGLFAVNFRVSGAASAPTLTVNPLSAVAPGFLRKLFGAGSVETEATGAAASPTPRVQR